MSSTIFNRPPGTPLTASRTAQRSAAADVCGSACHKGLSPDTPRSALDVLPASGSHTSPTLSPAFVAPASSASSSSCNANLTCRPVHELVAMIYNERKRTAAVEGELWILRQELTRVQHHPAEARCATPPLRPPVHAQRAAPATPSSTPAWGAPSRVEE